MAEKGQRVRIHYVGKLEDGTVIASTYDDDETFDFIVGGGNVLPAMEEAVLDMEEGDKKVITVAPEQAYGKYDPEKMETVDLEELPFPEEIVKRVGQTICFDGENGEFAEALIVAVNDGKVTLDFNSPLAGHTLTFEIELVSAKDAHFTYSKPVSTPAAPLAPGEKA